MLVAQPSGKPIHQLARNQYPVKILQFGSGNFLRGFADWMVQQANEKTGFNAGVSVVQSVSQSDTLKQQEGVYTVIFKGIHDGEFVSSHQKIDVIQRVVNPTLDFDAYLNEALNPDLQFIISNTTEAGITFSKQDTHVATLASTFPGKLTQLLYKRFQENIDSPLLVLPTELIEQNGTLLKACIVNYSGHWSLPSEFLIWLNTHVTFCNTLVDRIVSGFPKKPKEEVYEELGYVDELAVEGEWFHLWVIEGPRWINEILPFKKAGLNVIYTHDLEPYRIRKVRILNGAHTCMACVGYLAGMQTVRESIEHPVIGRFIKRLIYDDIVPHLPGELVELEKYAEEVINRFRNPALNHQLLSISLNSFSKFAVRVLPSLLAQADKNGMLAPRLMYSFAALIYFYGGLKNGKAITLKDSDEVIVFMAHAWQEAAPSKSGMENLCKKVLAKKEWWGKDLTEVPQLVEHTAWHLFEISRRGVLDSLKEL